MKLIIVSLVVASCVCVAQATYCRAPPAITNGYHNGGTRRDFRVNHVITYSCNDGYQLDGSATTTCLFNRRTWSYYWSHRAPTCVRASDDDDSSSSDSGSDSSSSDSGSDSSSSDSSSSQRCSQPSNPENGKVWYHSTTPGSIAKYTCNSGYKLSGNVYRKCLSTGQWHGDAATCTRPQCPKLSDPANGRVKSYSDGRNVGSVVWYRCNDGFRLVGSESTRCQSNLKWSSEAPTCQPTLCPELKNPANGRVKFTNAGRRVGAEVWYFCNDGFRLIGSESRRCQSNFKWSSEAPTCQPNLCPNLEHPANGRVRFTDAGRKVGARVWYRCNDGFQLVGSQYRYCRNNLEWSSEAPTCQPTLCPDLEHPANGRVRFTNAGRRIGARVWYKCNDGFQLVGSQYRYCRKNLEWSSEAPTCRPSLCPNLNNPENGRVKFTDAGRREGAEVWYFCNDGFQLVGSESRRCQSNLKWSSEAPICKPVCERLINPENGHVVHNGTAVYALAKYFCDEEFYLVGDRFRRCVETGWTGETPVCKPIIKCRELEPLKNGKIIFTNFTNVASVAKHRCSSGFELSGNRKRVCDVKGKWTGTPPTCIPIPKDCPTLPNPSNGAVEVTGLSPGSVATYTCAPGYVLIGDSERTCEDGGEWSGEPPSCKKVECSPLEAPDGGSVVLTGLQVGARATYSCNAGYVLEGVEIRICQKDGTWSGEEPRCRRVTCDDLSAPANGDVDQPGNSVGTVATYTCNDRFELVGDVSRTCQEDGDWSGMEPLCKLIVTCKDLDNPTNGDVDQPGNSVGTVATYTCITGYVLDGDQSRTCQKDGEWSGEDPVCVLVDCKNLPNPRDGAVSLTGTTYTSVATYSCNNGFTLVGQSTRVCQADGKWSGTAPSCERDIMCEELDNPANGMVMVTGQDPGSMAFYSCEMGFMLEGSMSRTCQSDGSWSDTEPTCVSVECDLLDDPLNGEVTLSGTTVGSTADYTCDTGYTLVGETQRVCQKNRQWSGVAPTCEPVDCGILFPPTNGMVDLSGGTTLDSVARYTCDPGFDLIGNDVRNCLASGLWSGTEPTCAPVECDLLDDPLNGEVTLSGTTVGSTADYTCDTGYTLVGETQRVCQKNEQWSGVAPTCELIDCGSLENPTNGQVVVTTTTFGSTAIYSCDLGYILNGVSSRSCQATGEWSEIEPTCSPVDCGILFPPTNGMVDLSGGTTLDSVARYTCDSGFDLIGNDVRNCLASGLWSGAEPTCAPVECDILDAPLNGEVTLSGTTVGSTADYTCDTGYTLVGDTRRVCQKNEQWSGVAPTCELIDCGSLEDPTNGQVVVTTTTFGSTALYSCDLGYILNGVSSRSCQATGEWSEIEPTCSPVDCGILFSPTNGMVDLSGGTTLDSVARYTCDPGFVIIGIDSRNCLINGLWSGSEPECREVISCPVLTNPLNGRVTVTGLEPFSTATYVCDSGYVLFGDDIRICSEDGEWTKDEPTCEPIDCGPLENPDNGRVEVFNTTLGSPAVYTCNRGFQRVGTRGRVCTETGEWSGIEPTCTPVECPTLTRPENGLISLNGVTFGSIATYTCNSGFVLEGNPQRVCLAAGDWSGTDPTCITPPPGCGDPGTPDNGLRIGDDLSVGAIVYYRCFDDYDLVGAKFRVCQQDGQWTNSVPTCVRFDDSCSNTAKHYYDRCGRRCNCVEGKLRDCCRVRKDYSGLSIDERKKYINTFLTVARDPIYKPRYDALVAKWKLSFDSNVTQSATPLMSQYFVFVRYFLLEYENLLQDIDCTVTIPFYDWTPFPTTPYAAPVWDNTDGFGDTARATDNCVITGPVRETQFNVTPSAGGGCLQREYRNQRFPSRDMVDRDLLPLPSDEFVSFHQFLQLFIGLNVQCFVGGHMCGVNAANDPVHILHLAQLDSLFSRWQQIGHGRGEVRYAFDNSLLDYSPGFRVSQFSNNQNLPYGSCVIYEPPVLLKNHAPPLPATLGRTTEITRMDCVPMEMMTFMDKMMDDAAHDFMEENCNKLRVFRSVRK